MSPDQQPTTTLNPAALQRLYARIGGQEHVIYELQATVEAQAAEIARGKDLLREAMEQYGPKDADADAPTPIEARGKKGTG